ncbi:MAG: lepB [Rickettsiaceae bacterium]|jgi:signal peptidase I|nr:lepB [Rickettsiaceae bacterium]
MTKQKEKESFGEIARSLVIAILLALVFRSFVFEPFYIPSGSMKSTLLVGDYVFVTKYSYGYSKYSLPLGLPLFEGRIAKHEPKRGDVVVFKLPTDNSTNYIKRLIGLPGDKIQMKNGVLIINGEQVQKKRIGNFKDQDQDGNVVDIPQFVETLPNGVSYLVLDQESKGSLDNTDVYEVPTGHYFFMGDNRDNSQDSRVLEKVGYVPEENLLGPAKWIFFSSKTSVFKFWDWFDSLRFSRFFTFITYKEDGNGAN